MGICIKKKDLKMSIAMSKICGLLFYCCLRFIKHKQIYICIDAFQFKPILNFKFGVYLKFNKELLHDV